MKERGLSTFDERKRMKIKIENRASLIRLRNIFAYKLLGKSTAVNKIINYKKCEEIAEHCRLNSLVGIREPGPLSDDIKYVSEMLMEGRVNILGSGYVRCSGEEDPLGLFGISYTKESVSTSSEKHENRYRFSDDYKEFFWNRDIKTGYIWRSDYFDENECIHSPLCVDVKNCWELGRLNFLVPFSFFISKSDGDIREKNRYIRRFKDLLMDFYLGNPVGTGIHWVLAMEAAIRISNILLSYDIVKQADVNRILDDDFDRMIRILTVQHIYFIYHNLEKRLSGGRSGNHYYADLAGLIFAIGYLQKRTRKLEDIFRFAYREFFRETKRQFFTAGGHYEGTTGYFRLTAEMLVFAAAILIRNGVEVPEDIWEIIYANKDVAEALRKSDHTFHSFGDCDAGRFIKSVSYGRYISNQEAEETYINLKGYAKRYKDGVFFLEDTENLNSLIEYTNGLLGEYDNSGLEAGLVSSIAGGTSGQTEKGKRFAGKEELWIKEQKRANWQYKYNSAFSLEIPVAEKENMKMETYNNTGMGFFVIKGKRFSFLFHYGINNEFGHSHNDSLSWTLEVDGKEDHGSGGTFAYTAVKGLRDLFRSQSLYHVPQHIHEQKDMKDYFSYSTRDYREVVGLTDDHIAVLYRNDLYEHVREIQVTDHKIMILDHSDDNFFVDEEPEHILSASYGMIEGDKRAIRKKIEEFIK
ncbi:MAG: hypothetical protein HFI35_02805 [Roseburia sp.]|nr:hypothetical protein [Roseburia sp.]